MNLRDVICSQVPHCLSCPLCIWLTGKDCHELSETEIKEYVSKVREAEAKK